MAVDCLKFTEGHADFALIEQVALSRGLSLNDAVQLLACSDLQRNTINFDLPVSDDLARFRRVVDYE